ncbi:hypothetical protein GF420_03130 [candidate division GN15 bacterium]|nr:hypothetical protein [candidate division GN15 bacterium]
MRHILRLLALLCLLTGLTVTVSAQSACDSPEASQFDFWIGEWNCHSSYTDSLGNDHPYTVHNTITKELDGCVIEENFDGSEIGLVGHSVSVYNTNLGKWQQTWVDNNGSYMDFEGGFEDGVMTLGRTVTTSDTTFRQRMRFTEITDSSFIWFWERSDDNGESWKILWRLDYERVK